METTTTTTTDLTTASNEEIRTMLRSLLQEIKHRYNLTALEREALNQIEVSVRNQDHLKQ